MRTKVLGLLIILFSFFSGWFWMDYQSSLNDPVIIDQAITFEIKKGQSFNTISNNLERQKVLIKPFWFKVIAYQKGYTQKLQAGEYTLKPGLTAVALLQMFSSGKTRNHSITFLEGWTFKQIKQAITEHPYLTHSIEGLSDAEILAQLGAAIQNPEGQFYPDTYFFDKNMLDTSLLQRAYSKMQSILAEEWSGREKGLPLKNAYQALILASIVEKETGDGLERPQIAGVFIRRLRKGMLLQTDPTVIYGMGKNYKGNIRLQDLKKPTPYNTYVIKGLPPTPIAIPGRDAIHAVLHPDKGKSLYFVAKGNGSHKFSATLKEHNHAVDVYQRKRKVK